MSAATVTEAYNAMAYGSDVVNLYPYHAISPEMIRAIQVSLPKLEIMATLNEEESDKLKEEFFATLVRA
jgi:2-keto-3-deoxy-6-phosphogluconate aldolase